MSNPPGEPVADGVVSDEDVVTGEEIGTPRSRPRRTAAVMIAAGMLGLDEALGRKPREEAPIVVDANGNPVDIDSDGMEVTVSSADGGEVAVASPPLPRSRPIVRPAAGRRRRGRAV